jgi:hypothetical protein
MGLRFTTLDIGLASSLRASMAENKITLQYWAAHIPNGLEHASPIS